MTGNSHDHHIGEFTIEVTGEAPSADVRGDQFVFWVSPFFFSFDFRIDLTLACCEIQFIIE
jgi:hypothetical protein